MAEMYLCIVASLVLSIVMLCLFRNITRPSKRRVSVKVTFDPAHATTCHDHCVRRTRTLANGRFTRCLFVTDTPHLREKTLPTTGMVNLFVHFESTEEGKAWANRLHAERDPSIVGIFVHEYTSKSIHLF